MHVSEGASGRARLRLVEPPPRPDPSPPGGDDGEAPAAAGSHLALVWDDGGPSLVALRPPISPGKARAVHHYARLAAEARSARAD
jgi:hypothetical protein